MHNHRSGATKARAAAALLLTIVLSAFVATAALGQCPASPPTQGGALPIHVSRAVHARRFSNN